jgi:hypothetical protein
MVKEATKGYTPEKQILCIREDGYLCMANTMGINASQGNAGMTLRPYPGKVDDTIEVRMKFLRGNDAPATGSDRVEAEMGRFNFENMSRTELCDFAMDEWGIDVSMHKTAHRTREVVMAIKANNGVLPVELGGALPQVASGIGGVAVEAKA